MIQPIERAYRTEIMSEHNTRFSEYERLSSQGLKPDIKRALSEFIDGFEDLQQKSEWTAAHGHNREIAFVSQSKD